MSKDPARPVLPGLCAVLLALAVGGCGGSPTKSTPPPDQFPTGPVIACPTAPPPIIASTGQSVTVVYGTPTSTGGAPAVAISCTPPSGASFPIGTNAVVCTATDARQRTASCTFNIVVEQPPRISTTGFVAFGDSITWGENGSTFLTAYGAGQIQQHVQVGSSQTYPAVLQQLMRARYTTQSPTVSNAGLPGEKAGSADALSRFTGVIANQAYGSVFVMEGTNDISDRDTSMIAPAIANLRRMLQAAKGRGMRPLIATIPPIVPGAPRGLAWSLVPIINDQIRQLAQSENVPLVDVNAAFGQSFAQYLGPDGLHPNEAGYAKIADTFFAEVKKVFETQATTTGLPVFAPFGFGPYR